MRDPIASLRDTDALDDIDGDNDDDGLSVGDRDTVDVTEDERVSPVTVARMDADGESLPVPVNVDDEVTEGDADLRDEDEIDGEREVEEVTL